MQKNMMAMAMALAALAVGGAEVNREKAFDDAFKAGETLTAENAFKALVADKPETAPIRYFQAAEVARQMGRETLRRDRLAHYLRVEKGWNATTEEAAWYLCLNGGSVEHYERLSKSMPASDTLYSIGCDLLRRANDAKRGQEILKLADVMLAKFPEDARRTAVMGTVIHTLWDAAFGIKAEDVRGLLVKYPIKDIGSYSSWNFHWMLAERRDDFPPEFRLEWCKRVGQVLPPTVFASVDRFDPGSKNTNEIGRCKSLAKLFKEVEPLVFKPGNSEQAKTLLACEIRLSGYYFKPNQTNEQAAAYYDLFNKTLATFEKGKVDRNWMRDRLNEMWNRKLLSAKTDYWQKLRNECPQYVNDDILISWWLRPVAEKAKNVNNVKAFCAKYPDRAWEARRRTRDLWAAYGETKQVMEDIESEFVANCAGNVDAWGTVNTIQALKISDPEKLAFLKRLYVRVGAHSFFNWLKKDKGAQDRLALLKAKEGQAFINEISDKKPAGDRLVRQTKEMLSLSRGKDNLCPDRAHALMKEVFADYKADYPQPNRAENALVNVILGKYYDLFRHNMRSCEAAAEVLLKGFGKQKKADWNMLREIQWSLREKPAIYLMVLDRRAEMTDDANVWSGYCFPKQVDALPATANLEKMSEQAIYELLCANLRRDAKDLRITEALKAKIVATAFRRFNLAKWNRDAAIETLNLLGSTATNKALMAQFPYDKVAGEVLDKDKGWQPGFALRFLEFAAQGGRRDAYLKRYLDSLAKLEPCDRVEPLVRLCGSWVVPMTVKKEDAFKDQYGDILAKNVLPTLKAVSDTKAPIARHTGSHEWIYRFNQYFDSDLRKDDKAARQLRGDVNREFSRLVCHGLRNVPTSWATRIHMNMAAYQAALRATNLVEMVKVADMVGRDARDWWDRGMIDLVNATRKAEAWQPLFLLVNAIPGDANGELVALSTRSRAEAATKLPGVYPVGEKDPAFPLYVAADELSRKNTEGALKLFNRNVAVFERELLKLPPDFVAWGVDQLRLQRGEKDAQLIRARKMATSIIASESKVTPELVAAMLLVRAESYRDQQNFEAAKLEYQSIRDNPTYHKTPSGRKAMFRAIDLQIESGAGSQAEQTLEYWLSQPDPEIQAEAHYFLARIAFDRKDYDECIKQLKEVFSINLTHTEARFLQGKWKLATNSEVDETDVWIGKLADRTAIRPGQQLSVTVQDRNLSVAGGGSSIPVIVTTDKGRDYERINLYPSARDPNLFKGFVDVGLGAAVPSNRLLEVTGVDTASYVIDPEFLKARGLSLNEPKKLRVVDDAKLAIGAGAPRTEESESKAQIEAMVNDEKTGAKKALTSILRPGNPLYIAVSDKDRSLGGKADKVEVSVETTSGDRLGKVSLTEVKPYSGVFRGTVPTSLPPPRAFASDTAVGFNPGDVINSKRDGIWRSLADSQAIKWFAVDTMGSHVVSNVTIKVNAPDDITALTLSGVLGKDTVSIATLPASDPKTKVGVKYQTANAGGFRGEEAMREYMTRAGAPKATSVSNFVYRPAWNDNNNVARFSGAFLQPAGYDYLRFKVVPASDAADALRHVTLTAQLDGKTFFTGKGPDLQNAALAVDVTPGAHWLDVFVTARSQKLDGFKLLWEPIGEEAREIPMDWFDAKKNKAVWDFVADKAVIKRTKEGFEATFNTPVRLRTIKWEFTGRRSPDVAVSAMSAMDTDGKLFLPVESDFSDAQSNGTLEVAPGDNIIVKYSDEITAAGPKRILERSMGSSFTDGKISINFEHVTTEYNTPRIGYHPAYRYIPGDTLVVVVRDTDLDVTEKADYLDVTVETSLGGKQKLRLLETAPVDKGDWKPEDGIHTGMFLGLLKTVREDAALPTNAPGKVALKLTLRSREDDVISVSYQDRENTLPGVPCVRSATVHATKPTVPRLTLFHTRNEVVVDKSVDARLKLAAIRKRVGNEKVDTVYTTLTLARPMSEAECASTNAIPVNIAAPIPVRINDPSRARHELSTLTLEAVTERELARAASEGDDPAIARATMKLGGPFELVKLVSGAEDARAARRGGSFNGLIHLAIGTIDNADERILEKRRNRWNSGNGDEVPDILAVNGNDIVRLTVKDGEKVVAKRTLSFVSGASLALLDSTWSAARGAVHAGERFYIQVRDADCDQTDEADRVTVEVKSPVTGRSRKVVLTESIPHSGVFNGTVRPYLFPKAEKIPACVTGGVDSAENAVADDRFAASFGDRLLVTYHDKVVLPGTEPGTLCATGIVHQGSDGSVRLFSKRFRDSDQAVLVQFRLAECLFEQAKEHRKLKQLDKSQKAIAKGQFILEEALKNYPDSSHVMQGEFLLANLFQELANEAKDAKDMAKARQLYTDALSRFSSIVAVWPEGEYAARSQYHKALCLEMLADYQRAAEEYVKMTYLYPDSELVGDATIRLATHYYTREKRYDVSARIYENFQRRFPQHAKAARALFMCGSCYIKQAEKILKEAEEAGGKRKAGFNVDQLVKDAYGKAAEAFERLGEVYRASAAPELKAQALYWAGDVYLRSGNAKKSYLSLKRCVFEFPETEWARRARGLLLQESNAFEHVADE